MPPWGWASPEDVAPLLPLSQLHSVLGTVLTACGCKGDSRSQDIVSQAVMSCEGKTEELNLLRSLLFRDYLGGEIPNNFQVNNFEALRM